MNRECYDIILHWHCIAFSLNRQVYKCSIISWRKPGPKNVIILSPNQLRGALRGRYWNLKYMVSPRYQNESTERSKQSGAGETGAASPVRSALRSALGQPRISLVTMWAKCPVNYPFESNLWVTLNIVLQSLLYHSVFQCDLFCFSFSQIRCGGRSFCSRDPTLH